MTHRPALPSLPVTDVLDALGDALRAGSNAVLIAPPGAGKTTLVPLALLDAEWRQGGRVIVLEPRRIAARTAARRMAQLLGEPVGKTVGYRVRFDTKTSADTKIEVVTEGVFLRLLSNNPGLEGVAAVLFDEFHERSLNSDLAMALCRDLQQGLRDDLRLLPMSATLEGASLTAFLDAPLIESEGRSFPIDISYQDRLPNEVLEQAVVKAVRGTLAQRSGSILVFLPGRREIERCYEALDGKLGAGTKLFRLYGALDPAEQDAAIAVPQSGTRHVILASAIAETSLTIEGVTTVIDSGLARQPVFDPQSGTARLETVKASKASIHQRAGRAGRFGPGYAVRLWREQQTAALPDHAPPEIEVSDLSGLAVALADWGVRDPKDLAWVTPPPDAATNEARSLLAMLGVVSDDGSLTPLGRQVANTGLDPRLGTMVLKAPETETYLAACLALLVQEQGVGGRGADLGQRLDRLLKDRSQRAKSIRVSAKMIVRTVSTSGGAQTLELHAQTTGRLLLNAYPDRVARRGGQNRFGAVRFKMANGRGVEIAAEDALASKEYLVVADLAGRAGSARILSTAAVEKQDILTVLADQVAQRSSLSFDVQQKAVVAKSGQMLGALELGNTKPTKPASQDALPILLQAIRDHGLLLLPITGSVEALLSRLRFAQHNAAALGLDPVLMMDDESLLNDLEDWLAPFLEGRTSLTSLAPTDLENALWYRATPLDRMTLGRVMPTHFLAPSGSNLPLRYESCCILEVRPQELFGLDRHPSIGSMPIELHLVSPAGRPIQITRDLPGFWRGSWTDVRADLRGRYPKHPWPENPLEAYPTARAKPRKR
ncbi:MAG: ATP-dependent helicase HrpB [Pseudomonadota bacterium]